MADTSVCQPWYLDPISITKPPNRGASSTNLEGWYLFSVLYTDLDFLQSTPGMSVNDKRVCWSLCWNQCAAHLNFVLLHGFLLIKWPLSWLSWCSLQAGAKKTTCFCFPDTSANQTPLQQNLNKLGAVCGCCDVWCHDPSWTTWEPLVVSKACLDFAKWEASVGHIHEARVHDMRKIIPGMSIRSVRICEGTQVEFTGFLWVSRVSVRCPNRSPGHHHLPCFAAMGIVYTLNWDRILIAEFISLYPEKVLQNGFGSLECSSFPTKFRTGNIFGSFLFPKRQKI